MDESDNRGSNVVSPSHPELVSSGEASTPVVPSAMHVLLDFQADKLPWSGQKRIKFFITGVAFPSLCFFLSLGGERISLRAWQSGKFDVYAGLLLGRNPLLSFMPFLVFSMVSLSAACIRPNLVRRGWVRFGIWTGMLLNVQYTILLMLATEGGFIMSIVVSAVVAGGLALLVYLGSLLAPNNWQISMAQIFLLTTLAAIGAMFFRIFPEPFWYIGSMVFLFSVLSAPALSLITYSRAAIRLGADLPANPRFLLPGIAWFMAWLAAWRYAVIQMLDEYSKLPTTAPGGCYVSSAAAHGHSAFVGVFCVYGEDKGNQKVANRKTIEPLRPVPINMQMCRLKFLEFAFKAASPQFHRVIRSIYDRLGPPLATFCRKNIWLADAAYLTLKPVELLARWIQQAARVQDQHLRRLY
jgi:MFS family permease